MRRRTWVLMSVTPALLGILALGACGGDDDDGAEVEIELDEWSVTPNRDSVGAGAIEFEATNRGTEDHELVIIRSDAEPDSLPVENSVVPEDQVDVVDEIEEFPPDESRTATFDLEAGNYVLICNLPAHYEQGMTTAFTVE